ncbi:MAG: hypothetical protein NZ959_11850 [Armatimonadetes bacterium]|nr:hypothetical protein [Armatimonadota bacterium]MDW8122677.1 hypothetical protein [Armatimonadota bacterium]
MRREVPVWVGVVAVIVVIIVIGGIFLLRRPRVQEGATPPPNAPIMQVGPALGGGPQGPGRIGGAPGAGQQQPQAPTPPVGGGQ